MQRPIRLKWKWNKLKTVDTSLLRVGYEEWNSAGSRTVVLLHGWPDSIRCCSGVAPGLALAGWRVLVPALRGFLPTRFPCARTRRAPHSSLRWGAICWISSMRSAGSSRRWPHPHPPVHHTHTRGNTS